MDGMTTYYKVLEKDGSAIHGTGEWAPGEWRSVDGELVPCENGLHLARREDLVSWLGPAIWTAETDGSEILVAGDKVVARRARILTKFDAWNERTARLFAADCAERVLPSYEGVYNDSRPRQAIEVTRRYAEGKAAKEEMVAAYWAAASAAANSANSAACWAVYWAAYSARCREAYWAPSAAAEAADEAVTAAVLSAALLTYRAANLGACWAATAAADSAAERAWQTERLFAYLEGGA